MELAETDPKIVFVSADSMKAARATAFVEKYPDRYFEAGIAEQNAVAVAAGLASCGLKPYLITYGGFITMRACEQVRTFVAYTGARTSSSSASTAASSAASARASPISPWRTLRFCARSPA